jgi:hypothetical protein
VVPVLIKEFLPSEIADALGIDDEAVEVENHSANRWVHDAKERIRPFVQGSSQ